MTLPNGDVSDIRSRVAQLAGGNNHCTARLSKETVVRIYYELSEDDQPSLFATSEAWQWSDYERRRTVADLVGLVYDVSENSTRSFNTDELLAIADALEGDSK